MQERVMRHFQTILGAAMCAALVSNGVAGQAIGSTILTFDIPSFTPAALQAYGDNVSSASQGGMSYGGTGGYTPHVVTEYEVLPAPSTFYSYPTGYGDLTNILWGPTNA